MTRRSLPVLLVVAALLAVLVVLLPWLPCSVCRQEPEQPVEIQGVPPTQDPGWYCPGCRDRRRRSPAAAWLRKRPSPLLEALAEPGDDSIAYFARIRALLKTLRDPSGPSPDYPSQNYRFLPTDDDDVFVLTLSGELKQPYDAQTRYPAWFFLFDLDANLLDCVVVEDQDRRFDVFVGFQDPSTAQGAPLYAHSRKFWEDGDSRVQFRITRRMPQRPVEELASSKGYAVPLRIRDARWEVLAK